MLIICIPSHGLNRSRRSCPRRVNSGNRNAPSMHHSRRRNVTTDYLYGWIKNGHVRKNPPPPPQKKKKKKKKSEPQRDVAGNAVCLLVACLTSQQQASVAQGRICTDNFTCCHTEIEVADQTFCLTQSLYTDTGPTSPSADPITPGAWQGSHWSANF